MSVRVVLVFYLAVFIKEVLGIVVLIQEGQGNGRLTAGKTAHITGVDAVVGHKLDHRVAYTVAACLCNEGGIGPTAAQRHERIKDRPAGKGTGGHAIPEYYVEDSLPYSDYSAHR